jgi:predicted secreted protein
MAYNASVSSFSWNAVVIDAVGTMALSYSRQPLEVTQIGSANTHFISGIANAVVALDIFYNATQHAALTADILSGNSKAFVVTLGTGDTISGTAYVVGYDWVSSNSDVVRASLTLQVEGAITINGTAAAAGANEI